MLAGRGLADDLVLQYPGEVVRDEDGIEASGERGVDVGLWAVADHPGAVMVACVLLREPAVGVAGLFRQDFDGGEVGR